MPLPFYYICSVGRSCFFEAPFVSSIAMQISTVYIHLMLTAVYVLSLCSPVCLFCLLVSLCFLSVYFIHSAALFVCLAVR